MKLWLNRIVDFFLWIAFCGMLATGFIIRYRLPPGRQGGHGLSIWGWSRHDWGDLHAWLAYAVCAAVLAHLILHWRWLRTAAWPRLRWPMFVGLLLGIALVLSVWFFPVAGGR